MTEALQAAAAIPRRSSCCPGAKMGAPEVLCLDRLGRASMWSIEYSIV